MYIYKRRYCAQLNFNTRKSEARTDIIDIISIKFNINVNRIWPRLGTVSRLSGNNQTFSAFQCVPQSTSSFFCGISKREGELLL